MCLFTIKKEEEEDVYVAPRRVYRREEHYRTSSPRRSSRVIVARPESAVIIPSRAPSVRIPTPVGKVLPPPQPVPVFVEPAPAAHDVQYVHVSPRSSISDDRSDYRYERREVRVERDYSPARSHRGNDYYEYRHVHGDVPQRLAPRRERSRSRSRSRQRYYDDDEEERTNVRVSRKVYT
jgi:hypothetical protein